MDLNQGDEVRGLDLDQVDTIRALMEYEAARTEPPAGFPDLPDIPAGRYTDPRFYELEQKHLWRKSWLLAAHMDEFPEVGSFRLWETAGQPVLLVRTKDDKINAFYNTCQHRGAPLVTEPEGKRKLITCKYHAWSYDHDGKLVAVPASEDWRNLDKDCRSLVKVRCENYGKLWFVNFDPEAPTLIDYLGPIADEWKQFQFDKCRLSKRHIWDLNCNWKVAMEANSEVYHVKFIHPQTVGDYLDDRRNVNVFYPGGHGRMIAPRDARSDPRPSAYATEGRREIDTVGELGRTCTVSYGVFPNWVSPLSPYTIPPLIFWPNGIDKCRLETWTLAPDWGDGEGPDTWTDKGEKLGAVLLEDTEFGDWIQKSMQSYGFKGVPLSYQEARIYHWNQNADRVIGIENIPEELRVKQVMGDEWLVPNDPRVEEMRALKVAAE